MCMANLVRHRLELIEQRVVAGKLFTRENPRVGDVEEEKVGA